MPGTRLRPLSAEQLRIAAAGAVELPVEQAPVWERFESSQGHALWGRYAWEEDGRTQALITLYSYDLRGFRYLWARRGPVWIREQSPGREAQFREDLRHLVRERDRGITFVRLHAAYSAPDLSHLLQAITYDRTVIIDTSGGTEESVLGSMTTDGRRAVRRARARMGAAGARVVEETGLTPEAFDEYYAVLEETARRDGFRPHAEHVYLDLLDSLGPDHARLFGVRVGPAPDAPLVCWDLVVVNDREATAYYGASSAGARAVLGPDALDFGVAVILAGEGVRGLDLMGAHSPRVPELYGVGRYKGRFARSYTDVDGAWDMPVRPVLYASLEAALRLKHGLEAQRSRIAAARAGGTVRLPLPGGRGRGGRLTGDQGPVSTPSALGRGRTASGHGVASR